MGIYGYRYVHFDVDLRKPVHCIFIVVYFCTPTIDIDVPQYNNLLIGTWKWRLVDRITKFTVCGTSFSVGRLFPVIAKHMINPYLQRTLDKYPELYHS